MAALSTPSSSAASIRVSKCRSDSGTNSHPNTTPFSFRPPKQTFGISSLILRFPPNFVRQLSNKARRNCSNIGVAQIVAASWSNNQPQSSAAAAAVDAAVSVPISQDEDVDLGSREILQFKGLENLHKPSFLNADGSVAVHAGIISHLTHLFFIYL